MAPPKKPVLSAPRPGSPARQPTSADGSGRAAPPALPPRPPSKATVAAATTTTVTKRSTAKRALPGTRKPRSKRAKPADNRSTVTTTTETAQKPVNVYDAVLGEAEDLLQAASEAQHLGRLKMASAYLLLLHARLVGLGKRFDRAQETEQQQQQQQQRPEEGEEQENNSTTLHESTPPNSSASTPTTATTAEATTPPPAGMQELARHLPAHIEFDSAMIEHLARAAIDLHHLRTGRKIHGDHSPNLLSKASPSSISSSVNGSENGERTASIAWTQKEKDTCQQLLKEGLSEAAIAAKLKGRTEAQVRAFVRNAKERQKGALALEQEFEESPRKKGRGRKPPTQAINTVPNAKVNAKFLLSGKAL